MASFEFIYRRPFACGSTRIRGGEILVKLE
jgi:hypothetical protein